MTDERALVDRLAAGDASAFDALARLYERPLFSYAYRMLRDETRAEDAVQDAFLLAFRGRDTFRGGSFKSWLFRILTNRCLDMLRDASRHATTPLETERDDEEGVRSEPVDPTPAVEDLVIGAALREAVEAALASVPPEQRAAVLLRDVQGFDYDEIARVTHSELGTVKSRIHRGRLAVRDYLVARGWRSRNPEATRNVGGKR